MQPDGSFAMICGRLTAYCQQHGDGSEGPGETLAAHEDGAVLLGQQAHQAEQAPLQNSAERWRDQRNRLTRYDGFENRVRGSARPGPALPGSAQLGPLTVDEPNGRHGDGEEAVLLHVHFDQHSGEDEEQQDEDEAAGDAHRLRHPASTDARLSQTAEGTPSVPAISHHCAVRDCRGCARK